MYGQFNIQQFYVLPTQCIYVFCVDHSTHKHPLFPYTTSTRAFEKTFGVVLRVFIVTATWKPIFYLKEK